MEKQRADILCCETANAMNAASGSARVTAACAQMIFKCDRCNHSHSSYHVNASVKAVSKYL